MADEAGALRRRLDATREAMAAGVPHDTIRRLVAEGRLDALREHASTAALRRDGAWDAWRSQRQGCPRCLGVGVHILYGLPGPLGGRAAAQGDVHLGGPWPPEARLWRCPACGNEWGRAEDDPPPLSRPR